MTDEPVIIFTGGGAPPGNKKQKAPKNQVAISWKAVLVLVAGLVLLAGLSSYVLWVVAMSITHKQVSVVAIIEAFLLPVAFFAGHWFGRTEVRGFLSGVDTAVDRIAQAVDLRDGAKVTLHQKLQTPPAPPPMPIYPAHGIPTPTEPPLPRLTFREAGDNQIIDL